MERIGTKSEKEWFDEFNELERRKAAYIADLERQLAEAKAEIADQFLLDDEFRKVAGEFDKSDSFCTESPLTIIKRMKAEIEAMRPMVESCEAMYEVHRNIAGTNILSGVTCPCLTCQWYRDYEARKKP